MADYFIARLLTAGATHFTRNFCLGESEIRMSKSDTPDERSAFEESLKLNGEAIDLNIGSRICTIICDVDTPETANLAAENIFEEALDVLSLESHGVGRFSLLKSGLSRNLNTSEIKPINKIIFRPTTVFAIEHERYPQITIKEHLLANKGVEICDRLLRALHWSRHASWEKNLHMRILFNWFAIEAILKKNENDNVAPKALFAMGFPSSNAGSIIDPRVLSEIEGHPKYSGYKTLLYKDMEAIREYRNNIVHSGHRPWDLRADELKRYTYITQTAKNSTLTFSIQGIYRGCKTTDDLWSAFPTIFADYDGLKDHVHGNIIFSLESKTYIHTLDR